MEEEKVTLIDEEENTWEMGFIRSKFYLFISFNFFLGGEYNLI
jgi:hypothetical protein